MHLTLGLEQWTITELQNHSITLHQPTTQNVICHPLSEVEHDLLGEVDWNSLSLIFCIHQCKNAAVVALFLDGDILKVQERAQWMCVKGMSLWNTHCLCESAYLHVFCQPQLWLQPFLILLQTFVFQVLQQGLQTENVISYIIQCSIT